MGNRLSKPLYYLSIAQSVASRSTCINKKWGAVIVKGDEIISTGYNGAPRGRANCVDIGSCYRLVHNIPRGTKYESCRSVHAECNAIISAARKDMINATMYLYGWDVVNQKFVDNANSCMMCKRMIINAGILEVVVIDVNGIGKDPNTGYGYRIIKVADWIKEDDLLAIDGDKAGY